MLNPQPSVTLATVPIFHMGPPQEVDHPGRQRSVAPRWKSEGIRGLRWRDGGEDDMSDVRCVAAFIVLVINHVPGNGFQAWIAELDDRLIECPCQ
jgi:hypothetical protein